MGVLYHYTCKKCGSAYCSFQPNDGLCATCNGDIKGNGYFEAKKDKGKLRWDLVPWECIEPLADILTFGAEKYAPNQWQNVPDAAERYKAALFRHLISWCKGEKKDPESGRSHLHHALCNLVFMIYFEKKEEKEAKEYAKIKKEYEILNKRVTDESKRV